jgi:hypothetical protein
MVRTTCQRERDMPAEQAAGASRGQPAQPQDPAEPGLPRDQRRPVEPGGHRVTDRVQDADPHLLLVLLRPVRRSGKRRRHRGQQPCDDQPPRRLLAAAGQVQDARRQPGTHRHLNRDRVQRMARPDTVQPVAQLAAPDQPGSTLPGEDLPIKPFCLLQARDQPHGGSHCPATRPPKKCPARC